MNAQDYQFIRRLRENKLLQDLLPQELNLKNGAVVIVCADCDQRQDINEILALMCLEHGERDRVHPLRLNGGGLLVSSTSPLVQDLREDRVLLKHARAALEMKSMQTVLIIGHFPCGAANSIGMSAPLALELLRRGKKELARAIPEAKVAILVHTDYGDLKPGGKKMYHLPSTTWETSDLPARFAQMA